jgi:nitrate/nitrite transport system substrate-binding protein
MEEFIDKNPKTYRSLVKAMIEACQYCSKPETAKKLPRYLPSARLRCKT